MYVWPSRISGSGREASPGCPAVVGRPSIMSGSGREALPNVREAILPDIREAILPDIREALPDVQLLSEGPLKCPRVIGRSSRMSGSGWEALPDVREWSGGLPGCP